MGKQMIIKTPPSVEGRKTRTHHGVVVGEANLGAVLRIVP